MPLLLLLGGLRAAGADPGWALALALAVGPADGSADPPAPTPAVDEEGDVDDVMSVVTLVDDDEAAGEG